MTTHIDRRSAPLTALALLLTLAQSFAQTSSTAGERSWSAHSPPHRVALLELYTSEGCSSCPPADRWLAQLNGSKQSDRSVETRLDQQLIPLSFHVTYWDYIGWRDRFGQTRFDERQRQTARHAGSRSIYTPQFVLNGRDFRSFRKIDSAVESTNAEAAQASLRLKLTETRPRSLRFELDGKTDIADTAIYLAWYENGLSSIVDAGENDGRALHHDFVVRRLIGPFTAEELKRGISETRRLPNSWNADQLGLVAFAQGADGRILQAVRIRLSETTTRDSQRN